ncbi:MAG: hypothetical protein QM484_08830 [Woeseiaceae bacterium]
MHLKKQNYVSRTCTEVAYGQDGGVEHLSENKPLSDYRDISAYVLLGDSGAGKTESFKYESQQPGCMYITAREFINFDTEDSWKNKVLFIDGLDEIRAGTINGLVPLDAIRKQLKKLGCPSFRISCREADWLGAGDSQDLNAITSQEGIVVLHLEPLNEEGISKIAQYENPSLNLEKFFEWARKQDFISLLGNPVILKIFIKAVSDDDWPDSRKQAYEMACKEFVLEDNREHRAANRQCMHSTEKILNTAGMLYVHLLISGIEGYALSPENKNKQYPYFNEIFNNNSGLIEHTLKSKLFEHGNSDGLRKPLHRSIAGFLAAGYLNQLIEKKGLPLGRVLSLITSPDGGIVSSLRELYAWLVTVCVNHRESMLSRDPHGVVLYGDVTFFTRQQKEILLHYLYNEATQHPGFRSENWIRSPFGALATPDMEDVFQKIIVSSSRDSANQALIDCVMDSIEYGASYPKLKKSLLNIVKDHTWYSGIRRSALHILFKNYDNSPNNFKEYLTLLEDIKNGITEDSDDDLLGILLLQMYPAVLPVSKVLDYLHKPKNESYCGMYYKFWRDDFVKKSSRNEIAELLDILSNKKEIKGFIRPYSFYDFLGELLTKGLMLWGDSISDSRLYDWLGILLDKYGHSSANQNRQKVTASQWISKKPERYKAILMEGASRLAKGPSSSFHHVYDRLIGVKAPPDIGYWYLEQAIAYKNDEIANGFFREAVSFLELDENQIDFTLDDVFEWVNHHPEFRTTLEDLLVVKGERYDMIIENASSRKKRNKEENQRKLKWITELIKHKEEIKNGTASPAIFHDIAFAYYGHLIEARGDTSHERLQSIFPGRYDMYEVSLTGLKKVINRSDFPSIQDIIKTHIDSRSYYIGQAVLAGLDEIYTQSPDDLNNLTEQQINYALIFYFTEITGNKSLWLEFFLKNNHDLMSDIFIQYATACLKSGKDHITGIYQLAFDELWSKIAIKSVIPILKKFPVRAKTQQIHMLDELLKAALRYECPELLSLIGSKLKTKSMDVMQRSKWFAAGLLLNPKPYEGKVYEFMGGNSKRIHAVAGFLTSRRDQWKYEYKLPETTMGVLIQKMGSLFKPDVKPYGKTYTVTPAMDAVNLVSSLINKLSAIESVDANSELERLVELPDLANWKDQLRGALYHQRKAMRDAVFQVPDIFQVRKTLDNAEPANAADLMSITQTHLYGLANYIRHGSTKDYMQYWREDRPQIENACRDALLSDLKKLLAPLKIDASKEGYYADEKRADIKVSYNDGEGFNVPIEIKLSESRELWSALWEQLIKKYTRDPGAQGYGIYLVFWFGIEFIAPPPYGKKPKSALELKDMLLGMMSEDERRLIGLCVIDCSKH